MKPMDCREAEGWISIRVDGERIPEIEEARLEVHLKGCASCGGIFRIESRRAAILGGALGAAGRETGPLASRIIERAGGHGAEPPPIRSIRWILPAAAAAAVLLAALGIATFFPSSPQKEGNGAEVAKATDGLIIPASLMLEERTYEGDVVAGKDGSPMGRGVQKTHWIYNLPLGSPEAGGGSSKANRRTQLIFDVERVDTRYEKLASWDYR